MLYVKSMMTPVRQTAYVTPAITAGGSVETNAMNISLWIFQVLWGVFFCFTGFGKVMCYRADVWNHTLLQPVAWFSAVPQGLFVFIGVCEFLGGAGLILPGMTGIKPRLVSFAAIGLALVMILAAIFHIVRGEYSFFVPINLLLGGVAAFIAYRRLKATPIVVRPVSTLRVVTGMAVLGALALSGLLPVWYQMALTH
jgi:DoxX-like family